MIFQLFLFTTYLSIFLSFVNRDTTSISLVFSLLGVLLGFYYLFTQKQKLEIPKHFGTVLLFAIILQIYLIFIPDKLNPFIYAVTITEGLGYWLIFYNLKGGHTILRNIIFRFSVFYSLIFLISHVFNISLVKLGGLMFTQENPRHYFLGELWSLSLITYVYYEFSKSKVRNLTEWAKITLVACTGIFFLIFSNSRGALLSLAFAVGYILIKKGRNMRITPLIYILFTGMFIFLSLGKTTIFDRPYFVQSLEAFPKHMLGVGMGNFVQIGKEFEKAGVSDLSLSIYTHNIFLETLSGVGVFSVIFLFFLTKITVDIIKTKKGLVWGAVLLLILANFMYSTSYTVPAFIWIFFSALGVFQSTQQKA